MLVRFALPLSIALLSVAPGCEKEKPKVAAVDAAPSASSSAAEVVVDPKEAKYAELRKDLKDRNLAYLTSLQKIYGGDKGELATFKGFFPKTKEGEKEASGLVDEAAFTGKEGMSISTFTVDDIELDEKLEHCTAAISEKQMQRGKPRCVIYKLKWESQAGTFVRTAKTDVNVIDCP